MQTGRWLVATVAFLGIVPATRALAADTTASDLSIEYGFNRITNGDGLNMPVGLAATFGANVGKSFGVVADVRWNHKSESDFSFSLTSFHAGPRFQAQGESATFYAQGLAGATRASGEGSSDTKFSLMPGLGVDIKVSPSVGIRVGGDFRIIFTEGEKEKDLLLHAGVVFHFGR